LAKIQLGKKKAPMRKPGRVAFVCFLPLVCTLHGQITTADVLGTVTDPSGGSVPNAHIVLINKGTLEERTVDSNASGEYRFTFLQSGHYRIGASAPGFKSFAVEDIALNAGDRFRQEVVLSIGQNAETVEVTSAPPALDTDSSVVSTVVTSQQVENLPLNGRNFIQLAQLSAGANEGTPAAIANGARPDDRRQTASVSVNAQPDTLNNQMVDGLDNNEGTIGTIGVRPSVEAIAEFRVQTLNYSAESGKTPGAVINLTTKSGTNDYHGSAYEFLRNDKLDGRDFFANMGPKPEYRQNQFGGSVGGPIKRNKIFFFGDYEGLRIIQGTTYTATVPTLFQERNPGNLSDTGGPIIPATQLDPIALKYFALIPAPNLPGRSNNFTYSPNMTQFSHTADVRVDHHFSDKDSFFVRYTFNKVDTLTPSAFPAVNGIEPGGPATYAGTAVDKAHQILLNYIHIFGPRVVLELKAGYTRINNTSYPVNYGKNYGNQFGIVNSNLDLFNSALPNVSITGYGGFGDSQYLPLVDRDNTFQYSGALTQTWGTHTLKYGPILIRRQIQNYQSTSGVGAFSFNTNPGGNALANFLTGTAYQVTRIEQLAPRYLRSWEPSVYLQDDWRITRKVTLNLGLRYDVITPDVDVHNFISNFDPLTARLLVAGQNGVSRSAGIRTDWKSIAPRVGFAANVRQGTVLRGGYAKVFFRDNTGPSVPFAGPPYVTTYSPNPLTVTLSTPLPNPTAQSTTNLSGAVRGMALDYENSYVHQASFNVEQAFGATVVSAGYVGLFGRKLRISPDLDLAPPSADPFATHDDLISPYCRMSLRSRIFSRKAT